MAVRDIGQVGNGGSLMGVLIVIVGSVSGQTMPQEAQPKEPEHHQAETGMP